MENYDVLAAIGASQTTTAQDPRPEVQRAIYEDEFRRAQKTLAAMDASHDEILDDLRGDNPPRCKACGVAYIDHIGQEGLCYKLQAARAALRAVLSDPAMMYRRPIAFASGHEESVSEPLVRAALEASE